MKHFFDYKNSPFVSKNAKWWEIEDSNRLGELTLARNSRYIEGKRVLDLACGSGKLSYLSLLLGAQHVIGVDARIEPLEQAKKIIYPLYPQRAEFIQADIFDYLPKVKPQEFDTIICAGFLYHTLRQIEFFQEIKRLKPSFLILQTSIWRNYLGYGFHNFLKKHPSLQLINEDSIQARNTIDPLEMVFWPSQSFIEKILDSIGMKYNLVFGAYAPRLGNLFGLKDYHAVYVAWPKTI